MTRATTKRPEPLNDPDQETDTPPYVLDAQIGYLLRKAYQRNSLIFGEKVPDLTTMQFSVLRRLMTDGAMSQNLLGRSVAMDGATTKGVVDRLIDRGLLDTAPDPTDRRRRLISLTPNGAALIEKAVDAAGAVSAETLSPLTKREQDTLLRLLTRIT